MVCTGCGSEANASCNCGVAYVPKADRIKKAIEASPEKSTRAIAAELGDVSHVAVQKVRAAMEEAGVNQLTPDQRIGRDGKSYPAKLRVVQDDEASDDFDTPEDFWQRSLGNMAGEAISLEDFWSDKFGDWRKFQVTSDLVTLAKQASEAWGKLAKSLEEMSNG